MKGDNYSAWDIDEKDFPKDGTLEKKIQFIIGYGILAPSTHNTQPWKYSIHDNILKISIDPKLKLSEADPEGRGESISLGCFVANVLAAASEFGLEAKVVESSKSHHPVCVEFAVSKRAASGFSKAHAMVKRYSDKRIYLNSIVKNQHKTQILGLKTSLDTKLKLIEDKDMVFNLAGLQRDATLCYAGNRRFFAELSEWLKPSNTKLSEGMPGFVVGLSAPKSIVFRVLIKNLKPAAKLLAKKDYESVSTSPMIGIIGTDRDDKTSWFNTGRYYEDIALEATACGLVITPLAAIIENKQQRKKLAESVGLKNPQMFFRIGYSGNKPYHTPRRAVV